MDYEEFQFSIYKPTIKKVYRSFDEIMKDAEKAKTLDELKMYADEIFNNKKRYSLVCLLFAQEYFVELANKISP